MEGLFTPTAVEKNFFVDSVTAADRGTCVSIFDMLPNAVRVPGIKDRKMHDAGFAFLSTELAKLYTYVCEPKHFVTWNKDIKANMGGGFVDYVSYFTVDWAGIMNEFRNVMGNNANFLPRVNAGLNQKRVNVYTFEVAYDLRFVELEKLTKVQLQRSLKDIYGNVISAGWDLFVQKVAYTGMSGSTGLFNDPNVSVGTIDNSGASAGFKGLSDTAIVSFFNGVFEYYLLNSNMNITIIPDTFLVPTFVGADLSGRYNTLYTSTLRKFIIDHNLGIDEGAADKKITIASRNVLNTMGTTGKGRIVAYRNEEEFARIDIPYQMQQYITLPNIDRMAYTTAFVGQVSQVQLPYNTSSAEMGVVSYWDFTD